MSQEYPQGHEPIITKGEKKRGPIDAITLIAVVIVMAVIGINFLNREPSEETPANSETPNTEEESNAEETASLPENLRTDWVTPEEFDERATAEEVINRTQGKTEATGDMESIVYGVIPNEEDRNIVYFATTTNKMTGNFVGIYQYHRLTHRWQRFYKNAYLPEDGQPPKQLHVIGKEGRNLIVLVDRMGHELGACESPFLHGSEEYELLVISLDHPLDGFTEYTVPEALKTQEEERLADCEGA